MSYYDPPEPYWEPCYHCGGSNCDGLCFPPPEPCPEGCDCWTCKPMHGPDPAPPEAPADDVP